MRTENITLSEGKKIFFISDFHLGVPTAEISLERERKIIRWIESVQAEAQAIFFVGDVYDFWFEYKYTIPKGFMRFQGKLAELADRGIKLYFFPGNHDLWMFGYYEKELGATVSRKPIQFTINQKKFYVVHGDGYGPRDKLHKLMLKVFESRFFQAIFHNVPNWFSYGIAQNWSKHSRIANADFDEKFLGEDEWLWAYSKQLELIAHHDYYIFGHRHLPLDLKVGDNARYINLGEWFRACTYAVFDGNEVAFKKFEE